jgi:hypothetical protein
MYRRTGWASEGWIGTRKSQESELDKLHGRSFDCALCAPLRMTDSISAEKLGRSWEFEWRNTFI